MLTQECFHVKPVKRDTRTLANFRKEVAWNFCGKQETAQSSYLLENIATEIKNALVPIKTFLALFPERSNDPEFCAIFCHLATTEIDKLHDIANKLEKYAPTPAQETSLCRHEASPQDDYSGFLEVSLLPRRVRRVRVQQR